MANWRVIATIRAKKPHRWAWGSFHERLGETPLMGSCPILISLIFGSPLGGPDAEVARGSKFGRALRGLAARPVGCGGMRQYLVAAAAHPSSTSEWPSGPRSFTARAPSITKSRTARVAAWQRPHPNVGSNGTAASQQRGGRNAAAARVLWPSRSSLPRRAEIRPWPQGRLRCATCGTAGCVPPPPRTKAFLSRRFRLRFGRPP